MTEPDSDIIGGLTGAKTISVSEMRGFRRDLKGDVLTDRLNIIAYSQTAAMYESTPGLIVAPMDETDCRVVVDFARRNKLTIVARGGGTSLAGQALSSGGIIIDFTKYMGEIHEFDPDRNYVDVGPGLRLDELTEFLASHGKFLPPDPASGRAATLGGMAANNSGGSRSVKYGTMREWVLRLHMVFADTTTGIAERFDIGGRMEAAIEERGGLWPEILKKTEKLLSENEALIEAHRPGNVKNASGYLLYDVLMGYSFDPCRLIVGSEGTLGLITKLRVGILDLPPARKLSLSFYPDIQSMAAAVNVALEFNPVMLEVMDSQYVGLAREKSDVVRRLIPGEPAYVLMIEIEGESGLEVSHKMHRLREELHDVDGAPASGFALAEDDTQREDLLEVRRASNTILNRETGSRKPSDVIEDTSVHPEKLGEYLTRLEDILAKHNFNAIIYGHAGSGNLHIRPNLDLKKETDLNRMVKLSTDVAELVKSMGGTLSGEHGDGKLRTPLLKHFFGDLYPVFVQLKTIFDQANRLNPGVIVNQADLKPSKIKEGTKFGPEYTFARTDTLFDDEQMRDDIEACHGCGYCREYCPSYIATGNELDTPRARSAILRHIISGRLSSEAFSDADLGEMVASCLGCGRCERLCFAEAGYGKLSGASRVTRGDASPPGSGRKIAADIPWLARMQSRAPWMMDRLMNSGWFRRAMAPFTGISSSRSAPAFSSSPLAKHYPNRDPYGTHENPLAYFHGCYAGYMNVVGEGIPGIRLLEGLGYDLLVPEQSCCGVPKLYANDIDGVRGDAEHFAATFGKFAERGIRIVTTCPSCTHYLRGDFKLVAPNDSYELISPMVIDLNVLLLEELEKQDIGFSLPEPVRAAVHIPCHTALGGGGDALMDLLGQVEGLDLVQLTDECCGMGGSWGMKRANEEKSIKMGQARAKEIADAEVEIVITPCGMCAHQIGEISHVTTVHPIFLLEKALRKREVPGQTVKMSESEDSG